MRQHDHQRNHSIVHVLVRHAPPTAPYMLCMLCVQASTPILVTIFATSCAPNLPNAYQNHQGFTVFVPCINVVGNGVGPLCIMGALLKRVVVA